MSTAPSHSSMRVFMRVIKEFRIISVPSNKLKLTIQQHYPCFTIEHQGGISSKESPTNPENRMTRANQYRGAQSIK